MEIAIPIIALGGLYVVSKQASQSKNKDIQSVDNLEGFAERDLPNTNVPDVNYPELVNEYASSIEVTSKLSHDNKYVGGAYTDKFFDPAAPNNVYKNNLAGAGMKCSPGKTYTSLTGEAVDCEYFQHNNMVPYFKGNVRSRTMDGRANETLFDSYTGAGSTFIDKREQAPLFNPDENYNWAYGAPNQNDFFQSRVNPSLKIANVKPFQEEAVGPGLGLGYGSEGAGGYNSGMMNREAWLPKTVDDLRVDTHRKPEGVQLLGHEGAAIARVTNLGSIGQMEKNRVDTTYEMGQNRWLTTTGVVKNQPLRGLAVEHTIHREETSAAYGGIAGAGNVGAHVDGEYMPSKHIDLGPVPLSVANAVGRSGGSEADYGSKSHVSYANNRSANQQNNYFGVVSGAIGSILAPVLDTLRPSRKQNVVGTLRPYQNASTAVPLSYVFNPADRLATTIRETTENSKYHLNATSNQYNTGGYMVAGNQPIINSRMDQSDYYYAGNAGAGARSNLPRTYDAEYRQHNNDIKSSTIDGRLVPGNMSLFNNQTNIREGDRVSYVRNDRPPAPAPVLATQSPGLDTMGRLQGKQQLYSQIQADRTMPDIMSQLKGNPYALSITGSI